MILPLISAIAGAAGAAVGGGVEAAAVGGIGPAIGAAVETAATSATTAAVEVLPELAASPLAAEAVESAIPSVAKSTASTLKGVETVANMTPPIEAINPAGEVSVTKATEVPETPSGSNLANESGEKITEEKKLKTPEEIEAGFQAKLDRLQELRQYTDAAGAEIQQLEKELGQAKTEGMSPRMKAAIAAALIGGGAGINLNQQVKKDTE